MKLYLFNKRKNTVPGIFNYQCEKASEFLLKYYPVSFTILTSANDFGAVIANGTSLINYSYSFLPIPLKYFPILYENRLLVNILVDAIEYSQRYLTTITL
jgi:hypothetical protein